MNGANPAHIAGTDFVMIHMGLLDELSGDFYATLLFARIQFRGGTDGWWEATRARILADTRMSEYQFKHALQTLKNAGYVETERVSAYNATLRYRVVIAETTEKAHSAISTSHIPPSEVATIAVSETANSAVSTSSKNIEEQKQESPIVPTDFDEFWKAYPRKEGKGQARTAWKSACKKTTPPVLISAAIEYRQWLERQQKSPQFYAMPATWLNGERWLDERTVTKSNMESHMDLVENLWENENCFQTLQLDG